MLGEFIRKYTVHWVVEDVICIDELIHRYKRERAWVKQSGKGHDSGLWSDDLETKSVVHHQTKNHQ